MNDSLIEIAKILIPSIVTAVLSAVITVKLAIRKFFEERWWEQKVKTYSSLLEILHRFKSIYRRWYTDPLPGLKLSEDDKRVLGDQWKETNQDLTKLRDIASFHLSDDAISVLDEYLKRANKAPEPGFSLAQWHKDNLNAAEHCLDQLKEAAKRDLKVK